MSGRGFATKLAIAARLMLCSGAVLVLAPPVMAQGVVTYPYSYSGRLADASGAPQSGPVDVTASFWSADTGGTQQGQNFDFAAVNLSQGVFTLNFALTPAQIDAIFGDGTEAVFIEITAGGKTYPRQKFSFIPLAMRVPIDTKTLTFDASNGQLGIKSAKSAANGSVLTSDGAGGVSWTVPSASTTPQNSNALTALVGDVVATGPGSGTATLASVAIPGTATKVTFDVKGRITSGTTLSASDVTNALGFSPLSNVGITAGAGLNGGQITNGGTISLANTAVTAGSYTRANITVDAQGRITDAQNSAAIVDGDISATANIAQSKIAGLSNALAGRETAITAGTTAQYWRGDKTWQALTTAVVQESGTALYYSDTRARASLSTAAPLTYNSSTGGISIAQASGSANGYLSSSDWSAFNSKQDALGFPPLNKAGDTMSGTLNMGSRVITGIASPSGASDAATKAYVDGNLGGTTFDQTAKINDYVVKWNSSGNKYYLAADQTGSAGGGISTFNGLNSANQTLAVGSGGNAPAFSSSSSTHTLNIPMASAASVTAGLISNIDFAAFNSKVSNVAQGTGIAVSAASGTATVSLATTGTAGNYAKVTTDTYGRVTAGTTLSATDIPPLSAGIITSGTLAVSNGGTGATSLIANSVLLGNGTSPVQGVAPGTSGNVLTSNGSTWQSTALPASVTSVSGTAPISVTGTTTPMVSISQASSSTNGFLGSADWTTFSNKQAAGNYLSQTTGDLTLSGFASGTATASLASISLAGTSTKVTYDVKGRVTAGTTLNATDIPPISAGIIASGTLSVANGGTGSTSLTANNVLLGNGTSPLQVVAPGASGNVLTSNGTTWVSSASLSNWTTSGSDVYRSGGNVGIGPTAPVTKLTIGSLPQAGTGGIKAWFDYGLSIGSDSDLAYFGLKDEGSNRKDTVIAWGDDSNDNLRFIYSDWSSSELEVMRLTGTGNVGIGTTVPGSRLDVLSNGTARVIAGDGCLSSPNIYGGIGLGISTFTGCTSYSILGDGTNTYVNAPSGAVSFRVANVDKMVVTSAGKVGIGTTAPTAALQVSSGTSETLRLDGSSPAVTFYQHGNTWITGKIQSIDTGSWGGDLAISTEPSSGTGATPLVERMRITASGNVGIGTTAPLAALDVNGAVRLSKNSSQPYACNSSTDGSLALTNGFGLCLCVGSVSSWLRSDNLSQSCIWTSGSKTTLSYKGAEDTFVVPIGVSQLTLKAWGGGGGGSNYASGGGAGFTKTTLTVSAGDILKIKVAGGGQISSTGGSRASGGYNGGGVSGVILNSQVGGGGGATTVYLNGTLVLVAGGGGGAGNGYAGGAGGGASGSAGAPYSGVAGLSGGGGTSSGGGAAGSPDGSAGSSLQGGTGGPEQSSGHGAGGGGGGGYFGGGGASGGLSGSRTASGGGGGSSYAIASGANNTLTSGSSSNAGNNSDSDYQAGIGVGSSATGGNGLLVISLP